MPITETYIAPSMWALLTEEEQNTINEIKLRALGRWMTEKKAD